MQKTVKLELLPKSEYKGVNREDPIRFYYVPIIGGMYRKRVEMCLSMCGGGDAVLEVGFGTGLSFINLSRMYGKIYGIDLTANIEEVLSTFSARGIHPELINGNVLEMPYPDCSFDTVLLISILEHLKPADLGRAFREIRRVLKPGGQVVYGVPVEKPFMVMMFRLMGVNIREHHFSTEQDVAEAAGRIFKKTELSPMYSPIRFLGPVYEAGNFQRENQ